MRLMFQAMITRFHSPQAFWWPHRELLGSPNGFDDAEHRLRCLLAQRIEPFAFWCLQAVGHGLDRTDIPHLR
jgi:hypothetical protein